MKREFKKWPRSIWCLSKMQETWNCQRKLYEHNPNINSFEYIRNFWTKVCSFP